MAKTFTEDFAGPLYQASLCSRCRGSDTQRQRAEKKKKTSETQKRMNEKNAYRKLTRQLAANFPTAGSALIVTCTYDEKHLPRSRKPSECRRKVQEHVRSFLDRLRRMRAAAGLPEPRAFWSIEVLTSRSGRWHAHMVIDNTGQDYEMIRKAWIYGESMDFRPLRTDKVKNWETLARYMTKESRECQDELCRPGLNSWSHTRNIRKPERRTRIVPDSFVIPIPRNAVNVVIDRYESEYCSTMFVSYWLPEGADSRRPRARRKPRRR